MGFHSLAVGSTWLQSFEAWCSLLVVLKFNSIVSRDAAGCLWNLACRLLGRPRARPRRPARAGLFMGQLGYALVAHETAVLVHASFLVLFQSSAKNNKQARGLGCAAAGCDSGAQ